MSTTALNQLSPFEDESLYRVVSLMLVSSESLISLISLSLVIPLSTHKPTDKSLLFEWKYPRCGVARLIYALNRFLYSSK